MFPLPFLLEWLFPGDDAGRASAKALEGMSAEEFCRRAAPAKPIRSHPLNSADVPAEALFNYRDPLVSRAIWELKYRGNRALAKLFAEVLLAYLRKQVVKPNCLGQNFLFIPLPSSKERRRERGWNQTELVAEALGKLLEDSSPALSITIQTDILIKTRHTSRQADLPRVERLKNLIGCFSVANTEGLIAVHNNAHAPQKIILFDDVITTGATMASAAKVFRDTGYQPHCIALASAD